MSVEHITLDTNILVYAIDADAGQRHGMAIQVLEQALNGKCLLTLQSLSEFFNTVTRKKKISPKTASETVHELSELFPVVTAKPHTLTQAMQAVSDYKIAFWDAMLWSTAQDAGVTILLSEDFQQEQLIGRVRVVNPFIPNNFWNIH